MKKEMYKQIKKILNENLDETFILSNNSTIFK